MRAMPSARSGVVLLDEADLLFHYRLNEASSASNAADAGPDGFNLTQNGSPAVSGAVYDQTGTSVGARVFAASSDYFQRTATGYAAAAQGENSVWAWVFPNSLTGTQCLAYLGGTGASASGNNTQMVLRLIGDEVSLEWQHSTNTAVTCTTTGAGLVVDELYFILATRELDPNNAGKYRVRIDVWSLNDRKTRLHNNLHGLLHQEFFSNKTGPDGGGSTGRMVIAADYDFIGQAFTGELSDVGMSRRALSYEWGREQFARAARDYDVGSLACRDTAAVRWRARALASYGTWQDLNALAGKGWLASASCTHSVDDKIGAGRVDLVREQDRRSNSETSRVLSLAPGMATSPLALIVRPKGRIIQEAALYPDRGAAQRDPYEWEYNVLHDGFAGKFGPARDNISIPIDGRGAVLRDMWIQTAKGYGDDASPEAVEDVAQEIVDDAKPSSYTYLEGVTPTIRAAVATGFSINEYLQEQEPVINAINSLLLEVGADFRYRWIDGLQEFVPDIASPDRTLATVSRTFSVDEIEEWESYDYGTDDIRNAISVTGRAQNGTDAAGQPVYERIEVTVEDSASIDQYGYLWAQINEGAASRLDSLAEITALANDALSDLKDPKVWARCALKGFFPFVELWDRYTFAADGRYRSSALTACVVGYTHEGGQDGRTRTVLEVRGDKPVATIEGWSTMISGAGQAPPGPLYTMPAITGLSYVAGVGHAEFTWDLPPNSIARNVDVYEVWTGASASFTTATGTLRARVRTNAWTRGGLDPASVDGYVRVRGRDIWGNYTPFTTGLAYTALYTTRRPSFKLSRDSTNVAFGAATFVNAGALLNGAAGDWDSHSALSGGTFTAPVDGEYTFDGMLKLRADATAGRVINIELREGTGVTPISERFSTNIGTVGVTLPFTFTIELAEGDTVELWVQDTGNDEMLPQTFWRGILDVHTP